MQVRGGRFAAGQLDEQPYAPAGAALGRVRLAVVVGGAGDVQVRPRDVAGEAVQELGRGAPARAALGRGVDDVRVAALDHLLVVGVEGHAPDGLAGALAGRLDLARPVLVGREQAGVGL